MWIFLSFPNYKHYSKAGWNHHQKVFNSYVLAYHSQVVCVRNDFKGFSHWEWLQYSKYSILAFYSDGWFYFNNQYKSIESNRPTCFSSYNADTIQRKLVIHTYNQSLLPSKLPSENLRRRFPQPSTQMSARELFSADFSFYYLSPLVMWSKYHNMVNSETFY